MLFQLNHPFDPRGRNPGLLFRLIIPMRIEVSLLLYTTRLLAFAAMLSASAGFAEKPEAIRFGVSSSGVGNPPRSAGGYTSIAQLHQYLEKEFAADGIPVKWIFFKGQGPAVNEALANNQLDFTSLGDLPSYIGRAVGLDARAVLVLSRRTDSYIGVQPNSGIASPKDLAGKRLTFNKGTASQLLANRVFEQAGIQERDVRIVNMEPANGKAAFLAGQVDAIFGTHDLLRLSEAGKVKIIYKSKENPSAYSASHVLVNQKFAERYPDLTRRVVKALVKAAHWASLEANRDSVFCLWGEAGPVKADVYREIYAGIPLGHRLSPLFDAYAYEANRRGIADAHRYKLIRKSYDVNAWIDTHYLDQALKDLNLETFWPQFDKDGRLLPNTKS